MLSNTLSGPPSKKQVNAQEVVHNDANITRGAIRGGELAVAILRGPKWR
jgi:hypothetical protein